MTKKKMARIRAFKTVVDGIEFRSRLEAAWYLLFRASGYQPVYEPSPFVLIDTHADEFLYLPDFEIASATSGKLYVEIKPDTSGELDSRDMRSIGLACMLGYEHPTVIIIGTPIRYRAFCVLQRHKGNPEGYSAAFHPDAIVEFYDRVCLCDSYPDENGPEDINLIDLLPQTQLVYEKNPFCNWAWNETRWKKRG